MQNLKHIAGFFVDSMEMQQFKVADSVGGHC